MRSPLRSAWPEDDLHPLSLLPFDFHAGARAAEHASKAEPTGTLWTGHPPRGGRLRRPRKFPRKGDAGPAPRGHARRVSVDRYGVGSGSGAAGGANSGSLWRSSRSVGETPRLVSEVVSPSAASSYDASA